MAENRCQMTAYRNPRDGKEFIEQYEAGRRDFSYISLQNARIGAYDLADVNLYRADLQETYFGEVLLERVCLDAATLTATEWYDVSLRDCSLRRASLDYAEIGWSTWSHNDFTEAGLELTLFREISMGSGDFTGARLDSTLLIGCDIRALCRASPTLVHTGPSFVDHTTVMKSILAPNLKDFLLRAGMSPIFVDYTVECALAVENPALSRMMQSTFISYGTPDAAFARKLYEALHENGVTAFFFPEHATPGKRLHRVMREGVNQHDRVVLVCSESSLTRPGVLNEIEETLAREAREGGETYLIPIRLDDYVFTGWAPARPDLAQAIRDRVVADFTGTDIDESRFNAALLRLLSALER
jgi:hypothetical protein